MLHFNGHHMLPVSWNSRWRTHQHTWGSWGCRALCDIPSGGSLNGFHIPSENTAKKGKSSNWTITQSEFPELTDRKCSHLDLFVGGHGTKDDLRKALRWKHSEADPSDHTAIFDERERLVLPVKIKTCISVRMYLHFISKWDEWWLSTVAPTDQTPAVWCTPWACVAAGERTHSGGRRATSRSSYWASGWGSSR